MKLPNLFLPLVTLWGKHDRTILTTVVIGGTFASVAVALKDRPRYEEILYECEESGCTNVQKAQRLLPATIPLMLSVATTVGAALWLWYRDGKKIGDLTDKASSAMNAYMSGKTIQDEYRAKYGDEEADEVERTVSRRRAAEAYEEMNKSSKARIIDTGNGSDLFWDEWSGNFFYSDWNHVSKVVKAAEDEVRSEMWMPMDHIYLDWGWPPARIPGCAEEFGWNVDNGKIELFEPQGDFDDDLKKPYAIVQFRNKPTYRYERRRY